jgi:hypothetical protein
MGILPNSKFRELDGLNKCNKDHIPLGKREKRSSWSE